MSEQPGRQPTPDLAVDAPSVPATPYLNVLAISPVQKTVPYQGTGIVRADGGANHGFKNLKRNPELLDTIPEFASDPALRSLMAAIDRPETGLFSIACESQTVTDERGCRLSGYVEFARNCREAITDAASCFRLFHEFDRRLRREGFAEPVSFQWVICSTRFAEVDLDGFAVEVRVDTDYRPEAGAAYECWTRALAALEALLTGVPAGPGAPIYAPK